MEWIMLLLAGLFEVAWAVTMKYSEGFTRLWPSLITAIGYLASALFLSAALRKLPLGTAYAMWTGFGILGTTLLGALLFHEAISLPQGICLLMTAAGIVGLKLLTA